MRPTARNNRPTLSSNGPQQRFTKGMDRPSSRPSTRPSTMIGQGRPSTFANGFQSQQQQSRSGPTPQQELTGRPSRLPGPPNRMSQMPNQRPSEMVRKTTNGSSFNSFDEYQSSDHFKQQQKNGRPQPRATNFKEQTTRDSSEQEFARCSMDSSHSSQRTINSEADSLDAKMENRKYPSMFRGTGQNGQILKEDMQIWSRKLHNTKLNTNIYKHEKVPQRSIMILVTFMIIGTIILTINLQDQENLDKNVLKIIAGLLLFIPGFYGSCVSCMTCLKNRSGKQKSIHLPARLEYQYKTIAHFERHQWWLDDEGSDE